MTIYNGTCLSVRDKFRLLYAILMTKNPYQKKIGKETKRKDMVKYNDNCGIYVGRDGIFRTKRRAVKTPTQNV